MPGIWAAVPVPPVTTASIMRVMSFAVLVRIARLIEHGDMAAPEVARTLRRLAIASLVCWSGAITAGRLLAYTYTRLRA